MGKVEFDSRGLSPEMLKLSVDVTADEYWAHLLRQMADTINAFDPGIMEELHLENPANRNLQSIVRYCIPLFEMHRAIDGVEPDPVWLAAMYIWQGAWRPLDNLLDNDGPFAANFREYNISILRAWTFHTKISSNSHLMEGFLKCLYDTLDIEESTLERSNPALIFKRARLYEVIFDDLPRLSNETKENFRTYINTITIAHDFGDLATDIQSGTTTFATATLRSIDPHCRLTSSHYRELQASSEATFRDQFKKLDKNMLRSCWVAGRNIEIFFNWAFHT